VRAGKICGADIIDPIGQARAVCGDLRQGRILLDPHMIDAYRAINIQPASNV
jgi:hypothetical protein